MADEKPADDKCIAHYERYNYYGGNGDLIWLPVEFLIFFGLRIYDRYHYIKTGNKDRYNVRVLGQKCTCQKCVNPDDDVRKAVLKKRQITA